MNKTRKISTDFCLKEVELHGTTRALHIPLR